MRKRHIKWMVVVCAFVLFVGLFIRLSQNSLSFGGRGNVKSDQKIDLFRQIWPNVANRLVDLKRSNISILDKKTVYRLEDEIKLRIILFNRNGRRRRMGGDAIRVRIYEDSVNASAAGHVKDHGNGKYTATLRCLWAGTPSIRVYLYYTREVAELTEEISTTIPTVRYTLAVSKKEEMEKCHPLKRMLNGSRSICNLTELNGGMSWYCERPAKGNNSCGDIRYFTHGTIKPFLSFQQMFNVSRGPFEKTFKITVMPSKTDLRKCEGQYSKRSHACYVKMQPNRIKCLHYNREKLWNMTSPSGFFFENRWYMLHCTQLYFYNPEVVLRNRHLVLYGDSTVRQWFVDLKERFNCQLVTEKWTKPNWQFDSKAFCPQNNLTVDLVFHALPGNIDKGKLRFNSISRHLLKFLGSKESIFLIYLQNHFNVYHEEVFLDRISHIRDSVENVLRLNPKATIFIKGGHTIWSVFDYKNKLYRKIVKDTFRDISDKVIYLDNEDIAEAKQVKDPHPEPDVVRAMVNQMLAYIPDDSTENLGIVHDDV